MTRFRQVLLHAVAAALGVATLAALASARVPPAPVAIAFAAGLILTLPRRPWLVAAYCGGAAAAVLATLVLWTASDWGCASEVDGVVIEHDCAEPPPREANQAAQPVARPTG